MSWVDGVLGAVGLNGGKEAGRADAYEGKAQGTIGELGSSFRDASGYYRRGLADLWSPDAESRATTRADAEYVDGVRQYQEGNARRMTAMGVNGADQSRMNGGDDYRMSSYRVGARNDARERLRGARFQALEPGLRGGETALNATVGLAGQHRQSSDAANNRLWNTIGQVGSGIGMGMAYRAAPAAAALAPAAGAIAPSAAAFTTGQYANYAEGGMIPGPQDNEVTPLGSLDNEMSEPPARDRGMVRGPGTGTSDSVPAMVEGQQPVALSRKEFIVPADVVEILGTKALWDMIQKARKNAQEAPRQ